MTTPAPSGPPASLRVALGGALRVSAQVGLVCGLADGLGAGLRTETSGLSSWALGLAGAVGCYAFLAAVLLVPLGLLGRRAGDALERRLVTVALGLAVAGSLFWWTRSVVFPGHSVLDPRRLAAAAAFTAVGLGVGRLLAALQERLSPRLRRAVGWAGLAVALAGLGAVTLGRGDDPRGRITERNRDLPNVLLVVVDALRQDVLEPYGSTVVKTPRLAELARRGVVFENAEVQAPYTWTSFGSFLTGKYPRRHGLVKMAPGVRMRPNVTLAWHLKEAPFTDPGRGRLRAEDYVGATFMTGALSNGSGLMRGFDYYYEAMLGHPLTDGADPWSVFRSELLPFVLAAKLEQRFEVSPVAATARRWLGAHADRRFVALVHLYSTHTPYRPAEPYRSMYCDPDYDGPFRQGFWSWHREAIERGEYRPTPADIQEIRNLYYAGATQADAMIGSILDELRERGVLERTLVIVMSDHGEELGDHGLWEHNFMYETNLRIPLILAGPGLPAGVRVPDLVESVDLVPTLCELIGVEPPGRSQDPREQIDGVSLMPLVRGRTGPLKPYSFAENGRFLSVQDEHWKLILRRGAVAPEGWRKTLAKEAELPRLFDLSEDPGETSNRFDQEVPRAEELHRILSEYDQRMPVPLAEVVPSDRDRMAERLRELGYAGGIGQGAPEDDRP